MSGDDRTTTDLTLTVGSLQRELESLREALRLRALIEQAKGVLMFRDSIDADTAFARLREISQQQNTRVVDVAATLLGTVAPAGSALDVDDDALPERLRASSATSETWQSLRSEERVQQGRAGAVLDVLADSTRSGTEAAALVRDLLVADTVAAVTLWCQAGDGSLQQVGQVGYQGDSASAWQRIPPAVDVPVTRALATGESVFYRSEAALITDFPALSSYSLGYEAMASIPVPRPDGPWGVIGLSWTDTQDFPAAQRARLTSVVSRIGRVVLADLTPPTAEADYLSDLLSLRDGPWLVLLSTDGTLAGLTIEAASPHLPDSARWAGQRLLAVAPELASDPVLTDELRRMLQHGTRATTISPGPSSIAQATGLGPARLLRAGPRVVLTW